MVCAELKFTSILHLQYLHEIRLNFYEYLIFFVAYNLQIQNCIEDFANNTHMRNEKYFNIQSQNVRQRLKNHLNVQLTDSNVVCQNNLRQNQNSNNYKNNNFLKEYLEAEIFDSFQYQNDNNSENSLIHELGIFDRTQKSKNLIAQSSYFGKAQSKYFKDEYKNSKNNQQLSPIRKNAQSHYFPVTSTEKLHSRYAENITPKKGKNTNQFNLEQFDMPERFHHEKIAAESKLFSDIQSKISIIPSPMQKKIKNSLQNTLKGNLVKAKSSEFDLLDSANRQNHHEDYILQHLQVNMKDSTVLRQQRLNQLYQKVQRRQENRQKFISHNRERFQRNQSHKIFQNGERKISRSPIQYQKGNPQINRIKLQTKFKNTRQDQLIKSTQKNIQKISTQNFIKEKQLNGKGIKLKLDKKSSKYQAYLYRLQEQFSRSKVAKNYHKIIERVPKCEYCHKPFGAITKLVQLETSILSCNQCDLKNKLIRGNKLQNKHEKQQKIISIQLEQNYNVCDAQITMNHPLIGVFYDLQNKNFSQDDQQMMQNLLLNLNKQIENLDKMKNILQKLRLNVSQIKNKMRKNTKQTFQAKNLLKKLTSQIHIYDDQKKYFSQDQIKKIIPCQFMEELDIWYKIKSCQYNQWPAINQSIEMLCPLYMRSAEPNMTNINEYIRILSHNFQQNEMKISVSQGIPTQAKSFDSATFIIDGSYNIPVFESIKTLRLEFHNKRTFRQITSVMESLPISVQQIILKYNHKLNSHISAQKYPLLTKVCSLRMCKFLTADIQNCKDQDDLLNAMNSMTKKKQVSLKITRSLYVRNPLVNGTQKFVEMFKKLGKGIIKANFKLPLQFNQDQIYKFLIINSHTRLIQFSLQFQGPQQQPAKSYFNFDNKNQSKQQNNLLSIFQMLNSNEEPYQRQGQKQKLRHHDFSPDSFKNQLKQKQIFKKLLKLKNICLSILKTKQRVKTEGLCIIKVQPDQNVKQQREIQKRIKGISDLNLMIKNDLKLMKEMIAILF